MKSSYPRLRSVRGSERNPILTATTIVEIARHNGATSFKPFLDGNGNFGIRLIYGGWRGIVGSASDEPIHVPMPTFRNPPRIQSDCAV